jgi:phosphoribosylaminoimidazole-succinocarboxamide synthase
MNAKDLFNAIPHALDEVDIPILGPKTQGKVRDMYHFRGQRVLITTDRVSAFDRVLGTIPYKGQVLNQLSAWWFEHTADIVPHHMIALLDPCVIVAHEAQALPVEVIVRGYITGVTSTSLWTLYQQGERAPYGITLPEGLKKNDPLPHPVITPTTKAQHGAHDEQLSAQQVVERGLVSAELWAQIEVTALRLFQRGQALAERVGWILVDTKYEFGLVDGQLTLIDELHTPDSSRFWTLDSYRAGTPVSYSKEFLREWFVKQGYRGEGAIPRMPAEFVQEVAARYIYAYEALTRQPFIPGEQPARARVERALTAWAARQLSA